MDDRTLTGADVIAAARALGPDAVARLERLLGAGEPVADEDALLRRASPADLGVSPGAWYATFPPLFGEFE